MTTPTVVVVGLGPGDIDLLAPSAMDRLRGPGVVVLRTGVHPAARSLDSLPTFDHLYETSATFDEVYERIVAELVSLAKNHGEVTYGVPGSPLVAERTVELLRQTDDIEVVVIPALSFIDLAYAALSLDPLSSSVRVIDATEARERLRGPGPLLVAQCHSAAVLSDVKLSIDADLLEEPPRAVILHHLGLEDEQILDVAVDELDRFSAADHLTSVFIPELRTVGAAAEDLVDLMATLRSQCPWDQKQTHGSLTRHLLEEAYEALEALESLSAALEASDGSDEEIDRLYGDVAEELGDVVFQVVFHAHLASEEGQFDLAAVFDGVRTKLIGRHPHVFGDVQASTPDEVAANWEEIKKAEKGRASVTEGIPIALPALTRHTKLLRKASAISLTTSEERELVDRLALDLAAAIDATGERSDDATSESSGRAASAIGHLLADVVELAREAGVDPEAVLRQRSDELTRTIIAFEEESS